MIKIRNGYVKDLLENDYWNLSEIERLICDNFNTTNQQITIADVDCEYVYINVDNVVYTIDQEGNVEEQI